MVRSPSIRFGVLALIASVGLGAAPPPKKKVLSPKMKALNALIRHEPKVGTFLEIPTEYGPLVLDVLDEQAALKQPGMTAAKEADAEKKWSAARALYKPGAHQASERAMVALVREYPYWGKGHGALYDLNRFLKRWPEAEYHLKQLIAVQPTFDNLATLGEVYGRQGKFAESRTLLEHLFTKRGQAPRAEAQKVAATLLISLTKLKDGPAMVTVADQAIGTFGADPEWHYQAILGLVLQEKKAAAKERFDTVFAGLDRKHPLYSRFQQLGSVLTAR